MDTLVSLAGQFPLLGPVRDLHPLADIHASQTKILPLCLFIGVAEGFLMYGGTKKIIGLSKNDTDNTHIFVLKTPA